MLRCPCCVLVDRHMSKRGTCDGCSSDAWPDPLLRCGKLRRRRCVACGGRWKLEAGAASAASCGIGAAGPHFLLKSRSGQEGCCDRKVAGSAVGNHRDLLQNEARVVNGAAASLTAYIGSHTLQYACRDTTGWDGVRCSTPRINASNCLCLFISAAPSCFLWWPVRLTSERRLGVCPS